VVGKVVCFRCLGFCGGKTTQPPPRKKKQKTPRGVRGGPTPPPQNPEPHPPPQQPKHNPSAIKRKWTNLHIRPAPTKNVVVVWGSLWLGVARGVSRGGKKTPPLKQTTRIIVLNPVRYPPPPQRGMWCETKKKTQGRGGGDIICMAAVVCPS